ncbi:glycosyltransferase family 2 protein [Thiocapsa roseopersicina]|uniref:glycosyltransferase family 2 protein n=1 Tax=Thiocapsa roseopersicina TaxID=1058 RepID=UPI0015878975|nr:glycosyltransferase [Thiocapsa roseopersicina]
MIHSSDISIVIPTYGRDCVLVDTLAALLDLSVRAREILIVDQTPVHSPEVEEQLALWGAEGLVRRVTFGPPSIPQAMNVGLIAAETDYVLYLDDDIVPDRRLVAALVDALKAVEERVACIAGQVLQPGEQVIAFESWKRPWFPFNSDRRQAVSVVMAGNLCVRRDLALAIGGFDENFKGAALHFESEFARRVVAAKGRIMFDPTVSIRHLRAGHGGTRSKGGQLTTWRPHHSVGKYYFAFRQGFREGVTAVVVQPIRAIRTRHHLRAPWWIPATLFAELLGILWAGWLALRGPRLLDRGSAAPSVLARGV